MPRQARDVMQTEVVTVRPDMPLSELEGVHFLVTRVVTLMKKT